MPRRISRSLIAGLALFGLAFAACESPDVSYSTSPSARSMLGGTTAGGVLYGIPELPPDPVSPPDGWSIELGNARFEKLQNGVPSLFVVGQMTTKDGAAVEIWLSDEDETVAKWSGATSARYSGVVCWQQELQDGNVILPLEVGRQYELTVAFRDPDDGGIVAARQVPIRNTVPTLTGEAAQSGSDVFKHLLGCPRGS